MKTTVQTFTVTAAEAGQKLLQYLVRRIGGGVPQTALQRFIRTGQVRLDGKRCKPFDRVLAGQLVRMPPYEMADASPTVTDRPEMRPPKGRPALDILHEDAELLVLVKPAGLPVHPGSGHPFALTTILHERYAAASFRPTPAHRLDRDTTGVLLVAKSYRMLRHIHDAMATGEARKDYLAWIWGRWLLGAKDEWVTLRDVLAKTGEPGHERVETGENGKEAVSMVRLLTTSATASLVEVRLLTGRTQQIRAQLASRGYPLVGDVKYGGGVPPLRLHAWRVQLPEATFCAPPDWKAPWSVNRPRSVVRQSGRETSLNPGATAQSRPDAPE